MSDNNRLPEGFIEHAGPVGAYAWIPPQESTLFFTSESSSEGNFEDPVFEICLVWRCKETGQVARSAPWAVKVDIAKRITGRWGLKDVWRELTTIPKAKNLLALQSIGASSAQLAGLNWDSTKRLIPRLGDLGFECVGHDQLIGKIKSHLWGAVADAGQSSFGHDVELDTVFEHDEKADGNGPLDWGNQGVKALDDPIVSWYDIRPPDYDRTNIIGPGRLLNREGMMMLIGPTGCGKSTLTASMAFSFAIGSSCVGFRPSGALKVMIVQSEDDDGDLHAMKQGIVSDLDPTNEHAEMFRRNVRILSVNDKCGPEFIVLLGRILREERPDLLVINPISAYLGDDLNDQKVVADFIRRGVAPLLKKYQCAVIFVHHTPKERRDDRRNQDAEDAGSLAYAGAGSADLANACREVVVMQRRGNGLCRITATKRWKHLGWQDEDGNYVPSRLIAHGKHGSQMWRDAESKDLEAVGKRQFSALEVLRMVPPGGINKAELQERIAEEFGLEVATARKSLADYFRKKRHRINRAFTQPMILLNQAKRKRAEVFPGTSGRDVNWITLSQDASEILGPPTPPNSESEGCCGNQFGSDVE